MGVILTCLVVIADDEDGDDTKFALLYELSIMYSVRKGRGLEQVSFVGVYVIILELHAMLLRAKLSDLFVISTTRTDRCCSISTDRPD